MGRKEFEIENIDNSLNSFAKKEVIKEALVKRRWTQRVFWEKKYV